jgi:hypothetical protein
MFRAILICCFLSLGVFSWVNGQDSKFGGSLSYGRGGLHNLGQVQRYLDLVRAEDPAIQSYALTNERGRVFCMEVVAAYYFSRRFSIHTGLVFQDQKNDVLMDYYRSPDGGASYDSVHSAATFLLQSVAVPLSVKYSFRKKGWSPFLSAGTGYEVWFNKRMSSLETFSYRNGQLDGSVARSFSDRKLDGFTLGGVRYSMGAGVDVNLGGWRDGVLSFGFFYQGSLPHGEIWVEGVGDGYLGAANNKIYDRAFQDGLRADTGVRLNDWRNGCWMIRVGLIL